jgi:hypothetical protein
MLNFNYIRNLQQAFHKWLQFKWNGTLKDMMGFERLPWIWKYCLSKRRKSKKERNKKYKKTNNDGLLRNHKIVQLEPHKTSGWNRVPRKRVEFLLYLMLVIYSNTRCIHWLRLLSKVWLVLFSANIGKTYVVTLYCIDRSHNVIHSGH